ncbi:MAG: tetratricopeptide repeat protein [Flavobacteriaceae bacterium]
MFIINGVLFCQNQQDTVRIDNLLKRTWKLRYSEPQTAQKHLDSAEHLALKSKNTDQLAKVHYYRSVIYYLTGNNDECVSFAEKALELHKKTDNDYGQTSVYNLLGLVNQNIGDYDRAVDYYHKSLAIAEKGDNLYAVSNPLHNIAIIYQKTKDYNQALKYAKKALKIRQQIDNKDFIAESYLFIGGVYHLVGEFEEAKKTLLIAEKIFIEISNHPVGLSLTYNNLGMLYKDKGELKKAEDLFKKALALQKNQEGRYEDLINTLYNLSYVAIAQKDYTTAKKYASEANNIATQQNLLPGKRNALEALSDALAGLKDYEKAFFTHKELLDVADSLLNEEKSKQILNLEVKYQTAQKDKTIAEQALVLSEKDRKLAQRKMWLIFIGSFAILSLIIFYVIQNKKRVRLQKEEEQKINSAIFESEQKERVRIARDLHDSIGQKLSVMKMLLPKADGNENLTKISSFLDETATEVRSISHNLIPEILNFGLIKAIDEIADKINSTENIKVEFKADETLKQLSLPKQTEVSLYRIVQEILSNIVKHSQTDKILIEIKSLSGFVQINIKDNGVGFDTNVIDESEGLGWKNIFARIKLINGNLKIQSEKNKGSDFLINIPVV